MAEQSLLAMLQAARLVKVTGNHIFFTHDWLRLFLTGQTVEVQAERPIGGHWGERLIIGMTGNIAMGKSTVLAMLDALGAYAIDADNVVHHLREPGAAGYEPLVALMGRDILRQDGAVDQAKLAARAFQDKSLLAELEKIFRPLVVAEVERLCRASESRAVVVEAIKLLEGDLKDRIDTVWVVDAPPEQQVARLMRSRGLSREQSIARINTQNPQSEKLAQADVVIRNDGDLDQTWRQVLDAWADVLSRLAQAGWLDEQLAAVFLSTSLARAGADLPAEDLWSALARLARAISESNPLSIEQAAALLRSGDA